MPVRLKDLERQRFEIQSDECEGDSLLVEAVDRGDGIWIEIENASLGDDLETAESACIRLSIAEAKALGHFLLAWAAVFATSG